MAAGSISHGFQCEEAAFFRSDDGVNWTMTARFPPVTSSSPSCAPTTSFQRRRASWPIGQQRIWASTDGVAWTEVESPSWRALWPSGLPQLLGVASGPAAWWPSASTTDAGQSTGTGRTIVVHSADGSAWQEVHLPAEEMPIVRDVAAYPGGFVIVGRDGQPDGEASAQHPAVVPGIGRAAGWTSSDGVTWTEASVQADRVQGGGMTQLLLGSHGLFAVGVNSGSEFYPSVDYAAGAVVTAWASAHGSSWELAGAMGADLPPMGMLASDGTTMIGLGVRQPGVGQDPTAWASVDGVHWTALAVSGPAPDVGYVSLEPVLRYNPNRHGAVGSPRRAACPWCGRGRATRRAVRRPVVPPCHRDHPVNPARSRGLCPDGVPRRAAR